ncbi:MAG: protein kinase [Sedimentisphaerales bacterium]|nr:protein kinase [Sedimentisphaerales bacterium]
MDNFQFKYGDRPLEGYTIQRAAGRGGFGEVYYALSDSGRQVALKTIQNYEQIELRGIRQCMNLKSPHLVTIFDVKHNAENRPFVIMEYVSGPSLRQLLDDAPEGLGEQKAAFFLREIGKGLSFLHDCGIVHRDLKPGNIFYENGYVKIGDYGLSKAISSGARSEQTITVGTVHYMAPEIGAGCYDRSIDIYALGILLYEMLTGQVPFFGASPTEVLMKHMSAEPDLSHVSDTFARVIRKALAKDPNDRYTSVQEMVEDVFGSEHVRQSVSHFSPESLSMVASRVAGKAVSPKTPPPFKPESDEKQPPKDPFERLGGKLERIGNKLDGFGDKIGRDVSDKFSRKITELGGQNATVDPSHDPITEKQRKNLARICLLTVSLAVGVIHLNKSGDILLPAIFTFVMGWGSSLGIRLARFQWFNKMETEKGWLRNLLVGGCGLALATASVMVFSLVSWPFFGSRFLQSQSQVWPGFPFIIALCLINWWKLTSPTRNFRVSLGHTVIIGMLGFIVASIFETDVSLVIGVLAGTMLAVQIESPFISKELHGVAQRGATLHGRDYRHNAAAQAPGHPEPGRSRRARTLRPDRTADRPAQMISPVIRMLWLIGFFISLGAGLLLVIWSGIGDLGEDEFVVAISFGINSMLLSLLCLIKSFCKVFTGWYRYLIKPGILLVCVMAIITASISMGCMNLVEDELMMALFFIIFPSILFLIVLCIPGKTVEGVIKKSEPVSPTIRATDMVSPCKRVWALILSGGMLFWICGLHRFYVGKIGTGILWLVTFGLCGVGQIIDIIMILTGNFKDRYGYPLKIWESESELRRPEQRPSEAAAPIANGPGFAAQPVSPAPPDPTPMQPQVAVAGVDYTTPTMPSASSMHLTMASIRDFHPLAFLYSGMGTILLLAAFLFGLALAVHLPDIIASGVIDDGLAQEIETELGFANWPSLARQTGLIVATVLLLIGLSLKIMGRRHHGPSYMLRAAIGCLGVVFALSLFSDATSMVNWETLKYIPNSGQIVDEALRSVNSEKALIAGVLFIISILIMAWPAKNNRAIPAPAGAGQDHGQSNNHNHSSSPDEGQNLKQSYEGKEN